MSADQDELRPLFRQRVDLAASLTIELEAMPRERIRVVVTGELDLASSGALRDALIEELSAGRDVVLDMAEVTFIDSTGLAAIVAATHHAERGGRRFELEAEIQAQPMRLLEMTHIIESLSFANGGGPGPGLLDD